MKASGVDIKRKGRSMNRLSKLFLVMFAASFITKTTMASEPGAAKSELSVSELEATAGALAKESKSRNEAIEKVQAAIIKRGYLEGELLRVQDTLIQKIDRENTATGATTLSFLAIHSYLRSTWTLKEGSEANAVMKQFLPIALDRKFSPELRSHYLKRSHEKYRAQRQRNQDGAIALRNKLLEVSKNIETDSAAESSIRAEALGVIGMTDPDYSERRRLILKNCRSKDVALRKKALFLAGIARNSDDAVVEELLAQMKERKSLPGVVRKELDSSLWKIGRFATTSEEGATRAKILGVLEKLRDDSQEKADRAELDDLISRSKDDKPGRKTQP